MSTDPDTSTSVRADQQFVPAGCGVLSIIAGTLHPDRGCVRPQNSLRLPRVEEVPDEIGQSASVAVDAVGIERPVGPSSHPVSASISA
jgi:hypothetical protein